MTKDNTKKILYTATTDIHLMSFHIPYLQWFKDQGYEVHTAYKGTNPIPVSDKSWDISFGRSPFDKSNWKAFKNLRKVIKENHYDIIHCHTPMGGVITRLAALSSRKRGTKVLYTAHGFHFYNGGPIKNWLTFFPIEWLLSMFSDAIITINKEDLNHLYSKKFLSKGKYMINGIGLNPKRLNLTPQSEKPGLKEKLGYKKEDFLVLYIAEFIDRKNHAFVLNAIPEIIKRHPKIKFLFAGGGVLKDKMEQLSKDLGIENNVDFLGFRKDIGNYISISDIGISASKQEGLGLGVAEMMYNELPVIISEDRGHKELVKHNENGFMFQQNNQKEFIEYISELYTNDKLRQEIGHKGKLSMSNFLIDNSLKQMIEIYKKYV